MKRTLALKREALTELATVELGNVVGAVAPPTVPLADCLGDVPSRAQHTCVDCLTRAC